MPVWGTWVNLYQVSEVSLAMAEAPVTAQMRKAKLVQD